MKVSRVASSNCARCSPASSAVKRVICPRETVHAVAELHPVVPAQRPCRERNFPLTKVFGTDQLEGRYPGIQLIIARDRQGRVQGFQRYATAGDGNDVTLDVPWRRPGAPNGIDERLSVDMIISSRTHGARRLLEAPLIVG